MAIRKTTVDAITIGSTSGIAVSRTTISTSTGVYIALDAVANQKLAIEVQRDATTKTAKVVIAAGTDFSGVGVGASSVTLSSGAANVRQMIFPESARHKNSSGDIVITCTASTGVLNVAAFTVP